VGQDSEALACGNPGTSFRGFSAVGGHFQWNIVVAFWKIKGLIGKHAGIITLLAIAANSLALFAAVGCAFSMSLQGGGGLERTSLRDLGTQLVFAACGFLCTKAGARDSLFRKPGNRVALAEGAEGSSRMPPTAMEF
jgi:hypothetical protein